VAASADTVRVPGIGHVDIARSLSLWKGYGAPKAIIARGDWVDRPSVSIPITYVSSALLLGEALERSGRSAEADRIRRAGVEVAEATRTLDLFVAPQGGPAPPAVRGDAPKGATIPAKP
jgi:hypothetical protein